MTGIELLPPPASYGHYRLLAETSSTFAGSAAAATRVLGTNSQPTAGASSAAGSTPIILPFAAADHAVPGKATILRLQVVFGTQTVAPAANFTFGLAPMPVIGGTTGLIFSPSAQIADSVITLTTPAASALTSTVVEFGLTNVPDGMYSVTMIISGTTTANAFLYIATRLWVHNI